MDITNQQGEIYSCGEVEQQGEKLKGKLIKDRRKKVILGVYKDNKRACEVFAEIFCASHNKQKEFVMSKE